MHARGESVMAARPSLRQGPVILLACVLALATGSACRRAAPAAGAQETPTFDVTSWTDQTELFMEYPPLVAGEPARFAVHLTRLADFTALNVGRPHIELTPEAGGAPVTIPGTDPLRPGAFRVEGRMPAAGAYRWALVVDAPGLSDRHELGTVTVFADAARGAEAAGARPAADPAAIAYLKEQQWTNPFATARVQESDLRTRCVCPRRFEPVTGGEAVVAAPAAGRFRADDLVSIGEMVRAGRLLGLLEPRLAEGDDRVTLAGAVAETKVAVDAARAELARAETLVAEKAVPARRVDDARRALAVADARQRSAEARLAQRDEALRTGGGTAAENAFTLRAPLSGRVTEVSATLGASYEEGAPLFRIVRTDEVELQVLIPPVDVPRTADVAAVALEMPGRDEPLPLEVPSHAPFGRRRPADARADRANRGRQPGRPTPDRTVRHGGALRRIHGAHAGRARGGRADGGRPSLCVRPERRRAVRAPVRGRGRARRRPRGAARWREGW